MQPRLSLFSLLIWLCLLLGGSTHATDSPHVRHIDQAAWKTLTNDKAFSYRNETEHARPIPKASPNFFGALMGTIFMFFMSPAGRVLLWAIVLIALAYLFYHAVLKNGNFLWQRRKVKTDEHNADVDEDPMAADWEKQLQVAIANKDLRLAVRYTYMWLLHLLNDAALIKYTADKTNYEYAAELEKTTFRQQFRTLSRQYEYTWYGNYPISGQSYNEFFDLFNQVRKQLRK